MEEFNIKNFDLLKEQEVTKEIEEILDKALEIEIVSFLNFHIDHPCKVKISDTE